MEKTTLARPTLAAILAHARERHPEECCGAVVEADGRDRLLRFTNIQGRLHAENPADFPRDATTAYTPEPRELLEAIRAGEQPGARLKIFYHSHSKNGAYFSGEDRARGMFDGDPAYPDVSYLVVSDAREPGEARARSPYSSSVAPATLATTGRSPSAASSRASGISLSKPGLCSERNAGWMNGCVVMGPRTIAPVRDAASARTSDAVGALPAAFIAGSGSRMPATVVARSITARS